MHSYILKYFQLKLAVRILISRIPTHFCGLWFLILDICSEISQQRDLFEQPINLFIFRKTDRIFETLVKKLVIGRLLLLIKTLVFQNFSCFEKVQPKNHWDCRVFLSAG